LGNLEIVDVCPKPAGLSADLKVAANLATQDEATMDALAEKGFFVAPLEAGGPVEMFSNDGEFRVTMKDGAEYVLRFGEIAGGAAAAAKKDKAQKAGGLNRYLLVMAEFNPNIIPRPQIEPFPADEQTEKKPEKKPEKKAEKKAAAGDEKPAEKGQAGGKNDGEKKDAGKKADGEKSAAAKKADQAERERIEKANKRKQEEYEGKIADGKRRVAELNARFADWYYVISDEVYRKIRLTRGDVVKKKDAKPRKGQDNGGNPAAQETPAVGIGDLERLKESGPGGR
jgi:hypothetical protein